MSLKKIVTILIICLVYSCIFFSSAFAKEKPSIDKWKASFDGSTANTNVLYLMFLILLLKVFILVLHCVMNYGKELMGKSILIINHFPCWEEKLRC